VARAGLPILIIVFDDGALSLIQVKQEQNSLLKTPLLALSVHDHAHVTANSVDTRSRRGY